MPKIACIIVTYNGDQYIRKCLSSLSANVCDKKILVIDNGSTDETKKIIEEEFPMVDLVELKVNLGFGKANNIGLKRGLDSECDYFLLLNQDAWLADSGLDTLLKIYNGDKKYSIISPIHLSGDGNALDYYFSGYLASKKSSLLLYDLLMKKKIRPVYDTLFVNAAIWFMDKKTLENVGGFDEIFHHYGEDIDYINRLKYKKLNIGICPEVFAFHDRPQYARNRKGFNAMTKSIYIDELILLKDINIKFPIAIAKSLQNLLKNSIRSLLLFNIIKFSYFFYTLIILSFKLNLIAKHRSISKKIKYCFLTEY